ncbi:MAG: double-strand break repair helicase AddA [Pseudomonadota bacterium]
MTETKRHAIDIVPASLDLEETQAAQQRASRPDASAWVNANAGSGKTHVLKMRVQRLLLSGVKPEHILCLTFTKAAAAEMSNRVFTELGNWAVLNDDDLTKELVQLAGIDEPTPEILRQARRLFARAIETPGGLKVQTIHGFCQQLLQRFPLEADLPPGFEILDDGQAAELLDGAMTGMLETATSGGNTDLGDALNVAVRFAAEDRFSDVLRQALKQSQWLQILHAVQQFPAADRRRKMAYQAAVGSDPSDTLDAITNDIATVISGNELTAVIDAASASSKKTSVAVANGLRQAMGATTPAARAEHMIAVFLTGDLKPRKSVVTKDVTDEDVWIGPRLEVARDQVFALVQRRNALVVSEASDALARLAADVDRRYRAAKTERALLDFDDLIDRTVSLLHSSDDAQWVLFKLDGGIDHILIDEAQDTSGRQWQIATRLANAFFEANTDRDGPRTVFAVGDEKQSIYSFQGAEPRLFAEAGQAFAQKIKALGQAFHAVPLQLSFRTVPPILEAVDAVFANKTRTPGLTQTDTPVKHFAKRADGPGRIEIWEPEPRPETNAAPAFQPLADTTETSAIANLANRIADTIEHWLKHKRLLEARGRPIEAGDIMILLRRRKPLGAPIIAALKARGVAVAGADRMVLTDQLIVQDLMALGDFLTLPENDLALANALKSPLFNFDDDDLFRIASGQRGSLWSAMLRSAETNARDRAAADVLKGWRRVVDYAPPFETISDILSKPSHLAAPHQGGGRLSYRDHLLRRLGPDAADPLDEFLELALKYDDQASPSLLGFLAWLRGHTHEIKRDMENARNEVRLMTVHGAKGLEAPVVILPDTTSDPTRTQGEHLLDIETQLNVSPDEADVAAGSGPTHPVTFGVWRIPPAKYVPALERARDDRRKDLFDETNRLLYVAMTRAEDELYVCGIAPAKNAKVSDKAWYTLIRDAVEPMCDPVTTDLGETVLRYQTHASEPAVSPQPRDREEAATAPLPAWYDQAAPNEPLLQIPLVPSRLAPLETDSNGDPVDETSLTASNSIPLSERDAQAIAKTNPPQPAPQALAKDNRFLRGIITHALLQHLPSMSDDQWADTAKSFVSIRGAALTLRQQKSIVSETLTVLREPEFAAAFAPGGRAEVSFVAEVANPVSPAIPLKIAGQIDRLAVTDHDVLIIDYKTNRPPPDDVLSVPDAYLLQMAAYRLALQQIYPNRTVRAALLWTDGPRLMPLPDEYLERYATMLWKTQRNPVAATH